jgi:hypothetical protein
MCPVPEDHTFAPWNVLRETLAGSFAAHARGLLTSDFALINRRDREVGRLRVHGPEGAELEAGNLLASIEHTGTQRYAMLAGGVRILSAETTGTPEAMWVRRAERVYETTVALLRNTAEARLSTEERSARITGGLTNRRYEVTYDVDDEGSLPVAIFLLYRLVALRRGAYRVGARGG